ncbi:MAG: hypothetical protein NXH88_01790 [Hyphomonas sp.]|nr:hypothetical protein [Hyphomonas sp.]
MTDELVPPTTTDRMNAISRQMGLLFTYARCMNELDFAGSLSGEFRGAQDAGWSTTITAEQVYQELVARLDSDTPKSLPELRIVLLLYSQLAEAGGVYETLKNMMRIIEREPYNLWPFQDLVRVRKAPDRVIGPNANKTFRDLAEHARRIGMSALSEVLETVFRDDIRNGIAHADYILWGDGLRLRRRNGGQVFRLNFDEVSEAIGIGVGFYQTLRQLCMDAMRSFDPSQPITGRFSANPPMSWTVGIDPKDGGFSIKSSSPGPQTTEAFLRQEAINKFLSGRVLAMFTKEGGFQEHDVDFSSSGFAPAETELNDEQYDALLEEIEQNQLWDDHAENVSDGGLLGLSPRGFQWLTSQTDLDTLIGLPENDIVFEEPLARGTPKADK